jgi:anti-sigma regulatory factor (Ser/Thr protein kinase)
MKTRMQPIDNVWSKFPRLVRDLATACGKRVRIEMTGKDTDLDKTIIEAIKDPLTHVVRNAVDHGLESPEARIAAGKNPEGTLTLRAYHEGGHINIEIADDGGGINVAKVKARAIQRGLLTTEQAARTNDHDVARLVFLPGFSTADKVTNVSGRGVGMDVVKTNIEKIHMRIRAGPRSIRCFARSRKSTAPRRWRSCSPAWVTTVSADASTYARAAAVSSSRTRRPASSGACPASSPARDWPSAACR